DGMLAPVNDRAGTVALVWWVMLAISTAVLILVLVVLGAGLVRAHRSTGPVEREHSRGERMLVIGGGIVLPVVVMVFMMAFTLWSGQRVTESAPEGALRIEVTGHQWWWEIRYPDSGVVTANELHIPVGEDVHLTLI